MYRNVLKMTILFVVFVGLAALSLLGTTKSASAASISTTKGASVNAHTATCELLADGDTLCQEDNGAMCATSSDNLVTLCEPSALTNSSISSGDTSQPAMTGSDNSNQPTSTGSDNSAAEQETRNFITGNLNNQMSQYTNELQNNELQPNAEPPLFGAP